MTDFTECLARIAATPAAVDTQPLCACGAALFIWQGRRTGTVWVEHPRALRDCTRAGFSASGLTRETALRAYVEGAPVLGVIVSNDPPDEFAF